MSQLSFGGLHTQEKLLVLQKYLNAYVKILKNRPFQTVFFDAFAGTGEVPRDEDAGTLFEDVEEAQPFIEGSARRALSIRPPFDRYIFVEKKRSNARQLESLRGEFPALSTRIAVERCDANDAVLQFCANTDWARTRAVMFLDPFGNQVKWETIAAIARSRAIDLWYLFPAHLGVNRQISTSGAIEDAKAASLDGLLGTTEWRDEFLARKESVDLWGNVSERQVKQATVDSITRFMIRRMKVIFGGTVLDEWLPLGRGGSHWYSLLFACSNPSPKANQIAERLARAVMKRK